MMSSSLLIHQHIALYSFSPCDLLYTGTSKAFWGFSKHFDPEQVKTVEPCSWKVKPRWTQNNRANSQGECPSEEWMKTNWLLLLQTLTTKRVWSTFWVQNFLMGFLVQEKAEARTKKVSFLLLKGKLQWKKIMKGKAMRLVEWEDGEFIWLKLRNNIWEFSFRDYKSIDVAMCSSYVLNNARVVNFRTAL